MPARPRRSGCSGSAAVRCRSSWSATPVFFAPHHSTRAFLLTLNDIIHPEVRELYPGADVPVFEFGDAVPGALELVYRSPRRLCWLAEGFMLGAADHYGEVVVLEQSSCLHLGDDCCRIIGVFSERDHLLGTAARDRQRA